MLLQLEMNLQRVLGDDLTFGLPYWDWAQDDQLSPAAHRRAAHLGQELHGGQQDSRDHRAIRVQPRQIRTHRVFASPQVALPGNSFR